MSVSTDQNPLGSQHNNMAGCAGTGPDGRGFDSPSEGPAEALRRNADAPSPNPVQGSPHRRASSRQADATKDGYLRPGSHTASNGIERRLSTRDNNVAAFDEVSGATRTGRIRARARHSCEAVTRERHGRRGG